MVLYLMLYTRYMFQDRLQNRALPCFAVVVSKSLSVSVLFQNTSPEDLEKKQANSSAYRNFLNREGPRALGSKEIPQVKTHK